MVLLFFFKITISPLSIKFIRCSFCDSFKFYINKLTPNFNFSKHLKVIHVSLFIAMKKNKLVFLVLAALFALCMLWIGIDMSRKTTFPGSKRNLKERIAPSDTLDANVKETKD